MTTLSKLHFKPNFAGMHCQKVFGTRFVSVGYTPGWNGNAGNYYGDGKKHWEVLYGRDDDRDNATQVANASRQQVNTILRNMAMLGKIEALELQGNEPQPHHFD